MWKYLEKVLGKTSQYYENLMNSRDSKVKLSKTVIEEATKVLNPLEKIAFTLKVDKKDPKITEVPKNKKKAEIPYFGSVYHPDYALYLFIDNIKFKNDNSNIHLIVMEKHGHKDLETAKFSTLPIWEELIHYDTDAHHHIVGLANEQPWSLYRAAKKIIVGDAKRNQVSGYPQWLVNDIDFRKIVNKEFLFQMEIPDTENIIYFFKENGNSKTEFFIQKL